MAFPTRTWAVPVTVVVHAASAPDAVATVEMLLGVFEPVDGGRLIEIQVGESVAEVDPCKHSVHSNPGLIIPCPECGRD